MVPLLRGKCAYFVKMLYGFAKMVMWTTFHIYFRRIVFAGRERIPRDRPVLFISNHSGPFLDAMLLAVLMRRPLHFYARSDIFRNRLANWILRTFRLLPIYNSGFAKEELHRNEETFAEGEAVLLGGGQILIFPEGQARLERNRLPFKKGATRIALQTESRADFRLGLTVVPVGINYSRHAFRSDVLLQTGEPTCVSDYEEVYRENPAKAMTSLTRVLDARFDPTFFYVRQAERTGLIDRLLEIYRDEAFHPSDALRGVPVMEKEKRVCAAVSDLDDDGAAELTSKLEQYDAQLRQHGCLDGSVTGRYRWTFLHFLLLLAGLPLFLFWLPVNGPVLRFFRWVADRTVTRVDFHTSVLTAVGGFGYLLWWLFQIVVAALVSQPWAWALALAAPLVLYLGILWWESAVSFLSHLRYLMLRRRNPAAASELATLRGQIAIWRDF
jgi:glycerol-3-phosphate O-acyltransferase/dihydroxyacetone phosphate acyltransferase